MSNKNCFVSTVDPKKISSFGKSASYYKIMKWTTSSIPFLSNNKTPQKFVILIPQELFQYAHITLPANEFGNQFSYHATNFFLPRILSSKQIERYPTSLAQDRIEWPLISFVKLKRVIGKGKNFKNPASSDICNLSLKFGTHPTIS